MQKRYLIYGAALVFLYLKRNSLEGYVIRRSKNWTLFDPLFERYANKHGVPSVWLKALALNESSLGTAPSVARGLANPSDTLNSVSSDGKSWGLMQVTLSTAKMIDPSATPQKLNNAEYSIDLAARYVNSLIKMYSRTDSRFMEWVIKSYNQGPGNTGNEKSGKIKKGYADEYFARFERNLKLIQGF